MNTAGGLPTSVSDPPLSTPLLGPVLGCPPPGGPSLPGGPPGNPWPGNGCSSGPLLSEGSSWSGLISNVLLHHLGSSCGLWWDLLPQRLVPQLGQLMQQLFDSCCYNWGPGLFDPSTYWL